MNSSPRSRVAGVFLSTLLIVLVACGGGSSSSPTNTGSTTPTSGGSAPGASNPGNNGSGSGTTGSGSGTTGSSGGTGGSGSGGATLSTPKFVYALDSSAVAPSGVDEFRIDPSTGVLTNIGFLEIQPSQTDSLVGMAATPTTNFVYVGDWLGKLINILKADPNSGQLTKVSTMPVPDLQGYPEMVTDPAGKVLFVSDTSPAGPKIWVFNIGSAGDLSAVSGSPFTVSQSFVGLSTDANGKFLFGTAGNQILGFTIASNGAITPTPGSPTTVRPPVENPDKGPTDVVATVDPAGRYVYVADSTTTTAYVYSMDPSGKLTLVSGSPFQTGVPSETIAVDPLGHFVFGGEAQIYSMQVNQSSGALTSAPGSPTDNGPFRSGGEPVHDAKVDPSGKFVLFADSDQTKITVFAIDQTTGALTNVPGSPFLAAQSQLGGGSPTVIAITH